MPLEASLEMIDKVDRRIWLPAGITRRDMPIYRPTSCHSKLDLSGLKDARSVSFRSELFTSYI